MLLIVTIRNRREVQAIDNRRHRQDLTKQQAPEVLVELESYRATELSGRISSSWSL